MFHMNTENNTMKHFSPMMMMMMMMVVIITSCTRPPEIGRNESAPMASPFLRLRRSSRF